MSNDDNNKCMLNVTGVEMTRVAEKIVDSVVSLTEKSLDGLTSAETVRDIHCRSMDALSTVAEQLNMKTNISNCCFYNESTKKNCEHSTDGYDK